MSELLRTIERALRRQPSGLAFQCGAETITWAELDQRADHVAHALGAQGLRPGDRVACGLGASVELPVRLLAHLRAGLIHVPVNDRYRQAEIDHLFALTAPAACVGLDRPPEPERIASDATDPALILSTSGTTGAPKGVLHTHGSLLAGIGALTRLWDWSNADHQVLALPLFHVHGLGIGLLGALLHGVSTELIPQFSPSAVCEAMARGGTLFMGVPTMYVTLLEHFDAAPGSARAFRHARLCCAGSASLSEAILHRFEAHTGQRILERYGMSETLITISNPLRGERRAGAIGHALPGVELTIDGGDEGELWVRGETMMHGYWRDPEATHAAMSDGWFRTGDRVQRDADGYLHHRGRLSVDWIKSGGWRVGARELEVLLEAHPAVREVAVYGRPDATWGERVSAAVVLGEPLDQPEQVLADYLMAQVADYKRVRHWRFLEALPRNALGKVQKRRLLD